MINKELKDFSNDVLRLYCRTGSKEIESLFIKIANIDLMLFWKWLLKNGNLRRQLTDQSVYDAFEILSRIRNVFPYGMPIDKGVVVRTLYDGPKALKTIPVIVAFNDLINDPSVRDVLQPYRDIIELVANSFTSAKANTGAVLPDIVLIRNEFLRGSIEAPVKEIRETIQQKRIGMFQYLLSKFNEDIINAAETSGMHELAQEVSSGGLAKPVTSGLNKFIDFSGIDASSLQVCKPWVDFILKKPHYESQWGEYNHNMIEMVLMKESGNLSRENALEMIANYEKTVDVNKMLEENEKAVMYPAIDTSKINIDNRLNPKYVFLLSSFLFMLRAKIGLPTGIATNITY